MSNKRDLKAYVRYDGNGRVIPGSLILQRFKPKVGNWKETPAYQCCNYDSNCISFTTGSIVVGVSYILFNLEYSDSNFTITIDWGDGTVETIQPLSIESSITLSHIYTSEGPFTGKVCISNPLLIDSGMNIITASNVSNLQILKNLETLFNYSTITELNVSRLNSLVTLISTKTYLTTVNMSNCPNLTTVDLSYNFITSVNMYNSPNIDDLNLFENSLTQSSVDYILQTFVNNGLINGDVYLDGGTSASPSAGGLVNKGILESRGWNVDVN
jgi:hypothetical protein